jgi:hypothetical protein
MMTLNAKSRTKMNLYNNIVKHVQKDGIVMMI